MPTLAEIKKQKLLPERLIQEIEESLAALVRDGKIDSLDRGRLFTDGHILVTPTVDSSGPSASRIMPIRQAGRS
jgi:hypothetical protein